MLNYVILLHNVVYKYFLSLRDRLRYVAKTCKADDYSCPTCTAPEVLNYETDGLGYCDVVCSDTEKVVDGQCVVKTCEADNYNCVTCIDGDSLNYTADGSGYCVPCGSPDYVGSCTYVEYLPSGAVRARHDMVDGIRHGSYTTYFESGGLDYAATYVNGLLDGPAIDYFEDGTSTTCYFTDGTFNPDGCTDRG